VNRTFPNRLLARLPAALRTRVERSCASVELKLGQVLTDMDQRLTHVYFPTGGMISQVISLQRREVEVGIVGDEGMFGIQAGMGTDVSPVRAYVQGGGPALRMGIRDFNAHMERAAPLRELVSRYTFVVYSQAVQNAACNRFHVMEQRLARWLLLSADRSHADNFETTQRFLAAMLGVRRVGVTEAAGELAGRELISYTRGRIKIIDRVGLEKMACACYRTDRELYGRVMADGPAA
jgi:CRP-like cAMP-binding protein